MVPKRKNKTLIQLLFPLEDGEFKRLVTTVSLCIYITA